MGTKAVFLDRDGVVIKDKGTILRQEDMEVFRGAVTALRILKALGFLVIVVTNQPVVARGLITEKELSDLHVVLQKLVSADGPDQLIDDVFYCPHHPNADLVRYRVDCGCRKPKPGMIEAAKEMYGIDVTESYLIGDRITDIIAGTQAQCKKTILVETGAHRSPPIQTSAVIDVSIQPDLVCADLLQAAEMISKLER